MENEKSASDGTATCITIYLHDDATDEPKRFERALLIRLLQDPNGAWQTLETRQTTDRDEAKLLLIDAYSAITASPANTTPTPARR